jgi:hypothetical protein
METLGVSINLSKSIISKDIAEFAKKWKGHNVSFTPIGPGLILRSVRERKFIGMLLAEAWRLNLISIPALLDILQNPYGKKFPFKDFGLYLWSVVGIGSWLSKSQVEAYAITWAFSSIADKTLYQHTLWRSLLTISSDNIDNNLNKLKEEYTYFIRNWLKVYASRSWPFRLLELALKLIGPGFWIYVFSYERALSEMTNAKPLEKFKYGTWEEIQELAQSDFVPSISSIDWRSREQVKKLINHYDSLNQIFRGLALQGIPLGSGISVPEMIYEDPRIPYLNDRLKDTRSITRIIQQRSKPRGV